MLHAFPHSYGICALSFHSFPFSLCIASHDDVHMGYLCRAGPATSAPIDPSRLLWLDYVYGFDGFAHECAVGRNTNVMGYPFLEGARVVSSPSFLSLLFLSPNTCSNTLFFFKIQPIIQEHEELVWLIGNLKLEMSKCSRQIYGLGGFTYPDDDDDDDGDGNISGNLETTPNY